MACIRGRLDNIASKITAVVLACSVMPGAYSRTNYVIVIFFGVVVSNLTDKCMPRTASRMIALHLNTSQEQALTDGDLCGKSDGRGRLYLCHLDVSIQLIFPLVAMLTFCTIIRKHDHKKILNVLLSAVIISLTC